LTNSDDVTGSDTRESWGAMGSEVVMSLLESVILLDVMKVVSSEGDSTGHLSAKNDTFENSTSNGDWGGEWALLVDVGALHGGLWGLETETNLLIESWASGCLLSEDFLGVLEDAKLLLESSFSL